MDQVTSFVYSYGYPGIMGVLMLGIVGLPVPDEWLLIFAGYLVFRGDFHFLPALAAVAFGSIGGITVSYVLGRTLGIAFVRRYGRFFRITDEKMEHVNAWFGRTGRWSLPTGYFIPAIRHLAGFLAGASKLRFPVFASFAYPGAIAWSSSFLLTGYLFGREWAETGRAIHRGIVIGSVLAAALVFLCLFRREKRHRGS